MAEIKARSPGAAEEGALLLFRLRSMDCAQHTALWVKFACDVRNAPLSVHKGRERMTMSLDGNIVDFGVNFR
jgi:hypothetical protein